MDARRQMRARRRASIHRAPREHRDVRRQHTLRAARHDEQHPARNLLAAGFRGASVHTADAFDAERLAGGRGPFDAVLIDIDEPVRRKAGYLQLLRLWLPHLAPGALVLAHDVLHPRFAGELKDYLDFVSGPGFAASTTLPVDECGVALSVLDPSG